jgi:hypothetical protein
MARVGIAADTIAVHSGIYKRKSTLEKIVTLFFGFSQHMYHIKALLF